MSLRNIAHSHFWALCKTNCEGVLSNMQPTHVDLAGGFFLSFSQCIAHFFFHLKMKSLCIVWHYFVLALLCLFHVVYIFVGFFILLLFYIFLSAEKICNTQNNLISHTFITFVCYFATGKQSESIQCSKNTFKTLYCLQNISIQPRDSLKSLNKLNSVNFFSFLLYYYVAVLFFIEFDSFHLKWRFKIDIDIEIEMELFLCAKRN